MYVQAALLAVAPAAPGCNGDVGSSSELSADAEHHTSAGQLG